MLEQMWSLNLYLAANILLILGLSSLCWLYFDLFWQSRDKGFGSDKVRYSLLLSAGTGMLSLSFIIALIFSVNQNAPTSPSFGVHLLQTLGLIAVLLGIFIQKIPGVPALKKNSATDHSKKRTNNDGKKQRKKPSTKGLFPLALIVLPPINFVLTTAITARTIYKMRFGWSKEFKWLAGFWGALSGYFLFQFLQTLANGRLTWLEIATETYSPLWNLAQLMLIISVLFLFRWISLFLTFRMISRLFFTIWQFVIVGAIVLASAFSSFTIRATETQLLDLLEKNSQLVEYNLEQIESNSQDLLRVLAEDAEIQDAIAESNSSQLEVKLQNLIKNNSYLDRIIASNNQGLLIFDSDRPTVQGESLSNNLVIKNTLIEKTQTTGYHLERQSALTDDVLLSTATPIKNQLGEVIGALTSSKRLNDNYLDKLKDQTGQELIIYVAQNTTDAYTNTNPVKETSSSKSEPEYRRSASTILEQDGVTRALNIPFIKKGRSYEQIGQSENSETSYAKVTILTKPYYSAILNLQGVAGETTAQFVIANQQVLVIKTTQQALFNSFILALILSAIATIPSYFFAKSLEKSFKA